MDTRKVRPDQLILLASAVLLAAGGQLLLRMAMLRIGPIGTLTLTEPVRLFVQFLKEPLLWVAIPVYVLGFTFWLVILSRVSLSVAYPALAITYVIVPLLSIVFLGENVPWQRWLGICFVCIGVVLTSVMTK